jgi:hypothetical protein
MKGSSFTLRSLGLYIPTNTKIPSLNRHYKNQLVGIFRWK